MSDAIGPGEAARRLGVSTRTVQRWLREGRLPAIRIALGSATVAGLTAASLVHPLVVSSHVDPNLMVLAVGAGSLMCSHVNDSGFWMFKEYFGLSLRDTFDFTPEEWRLLLPLVAAGFFEQYDLALLTLVLVIPLYAVIRATDLWWLFGWLFFTGFTLA